MLRQLEEALSRRLGWPNVVVTANGTLALQLACQALGLEGEVICPAFTFPATVQALLRNALTPVMADVESSHLTLDLASVEAVITSRTTAIVAVHTFGHPADVIALADLARKHNLALVYDAAPATGVLAHGLPIALYGDASAVSFHATKILHSAEGGAVSALAAEVAATVRTLRNFGLSTTDHALAGGTNAKLNEIQSALGLLVLEELEEEMAGRARVMDAYISGLHDVAGLTMLRSEPHVRPNHANAVLRLRRDGRAMADEVQAKLHAEGIDSRRYFDLRYRVEGPVSFRAPTPVSDAAAHDVLCIPLWSGLRPADQDRVIETIRSTMGAS